MEMSAYEDTDSMKHIGTSVNQHGFLLRTNQSVAARSVSEARSWLAEAKIVQRDFAAFGLPKSNAAARTHTMVVPTYRLWKMR